MIELLGLAVLGFLGWLWADSMRAREAAMEIGRRACDAEQVQLLDETVALATWRLRRDASGHLTFLRTYQFEFSDTGDNRLTGQVTLLGRQLVGLYLQPRLWPRSDAPSASSH